MNLLFYLACEDEMVMNELKKRLDFGGIQPQFFSDLKDPRIGACRRIELNMDKILSEYIVDNKETLIPQKTGLSAREVANMFSPDNKAINFEQLTKLADGFDIMDINDIFRMDITPTCILGVSSSTMAAELGSDKYDLIISYPRTSIDSIVIEFQNYIDCIRHTMRLMDGIDAGTTMVSFKEYTFGASHDYDKHMFTLKDAANDTEQAIITMGLDESEYQLELDGKTYNDSYCLFRRNRVLHDYVVERIRKGICRDDQEYCDAVRSWGLDIDPKVRLPYGYYDVTREELFQHKTPWEYFEVVKYLTK